VTPAEIIYQRVSPCWTTPSARATFRSLSGLRHLSDRYYEWKNVADHYGLDALVPKARRSPRCPKPHRLTSSRPVDPGRDHATIGCRQYADRLGDRASPSPSRPCKSTWWSTGWASGPSAWPRRPPLRRRPSDCGADAERQDEPSGSAWPRGVRASSSARQLLYRQAQGGGQGVPADRHRRLHRFAVVAIVLGTPTGEMTARFIASPGLYRRYGIKVRAVLTDNGPEYIAGPSSRPWPPRDQHHRIPARSPTTTRLRALPGHHAPRMLAPAFHRRHFISIRQLQAEADAWLNTYNRRRRNHGDYMRGRTLKRSSTTTSETRQHDNHQHRPSVTSTLGPEVLGSATCPSMTASPTPSSPTGISPTSGGALRARGGLQHRRVVGALLDPQHAPRLATDIRSRCSSPA